MKTLLIILLLTGTASCLIDEDLRAKLLNRSDIHTRPNETTVIGVDMVLTSINKLDMVRQEFGTTFLLILTWVDQRLSWNSGPNEGECMIFYKNEIWTPPLLLTNAIEESMVIMNENILPMRVFSTGRVTWVTRISPTTRCPIDISTFPSDTQVCTINITSWVHTSSELKLVEINPNPDNVYHPVNLDSFTKDNSWELVYTSVQITNVSGIYGFEYENVMYSFRLHRYEGFYWKLIIIPGACVSFLMTLVFLIDPVDTSTRLSFLTSTMLALLFYSSVLTSLLPSVSKYDSTNVIGEFFGITMIFGTTLTGVVIIYGIAANIKAANIKAANIKAAKIKDENIQDENIQDENIQDENIQDENIQDANIQDENIQDENIQDENIQDANIQDENIQDENIQDENIKAANIKAAKIKDENIQDENIQDENIQDANIQDANIQDENIQDENIQDENIQDENIQDANIQDATKPDEHWYCLGKDGFCEQKRQCCLFQLINSLLFILALTIWGSGFGIFHEFFL